MNNIPGYGETVVCPYNSAHVVMKARFVTHLLRCEKNHPNSELVKCPFDLTHRVMPDQLQVSFEHTKFSIHIDRTPILMQYGCKDLQLFAFCFRHTRRPVHHVHHSINTATMCRTETTDWHPFRQPACNILVNARKM